MSRTVPVSPPEIVVDVPEADGAYKAGAGNAHRSQRTIEVVRPEIQEFDELGKFGGKIVVLPDVGLQDVAEVRHAVHDFRRRQTIATQLTLKVVVAHSFLLDQTVGPT